MAIKTPQLLAASKAQEINIADLANNQLNCKQIVATVAAPVYTPPAGSYATQQLITITSTTPDAIIRYTTDGSTPNLSSPVYTAPVQVGSGSSNITTTLKSYATHVGFVDSAVTTGVYMTGATAVIRWGFSSNTTLTEAQILALSNVLTVSTQFGSFVFPAATVNDYAFFWYPDTFPAVGVNPSGFTSAGFGVAMATNTEGFTSGPQSGYYWLPVTVSTVPGQLRRTFFKVGSSSPLTISINP